MRKGSAIPLVYRHNHIEEALLVYSSQACSVYLLADGQEEPAFVRLKFDGVQCVRSAATDCSPAIGIYPEESGVSFIVELTETTWPIEARRDYKYATSAIQPRGRHFVVSNHDIFHEVLADSFSESLVRAGSTEHAFVSMLVRSD